MPPKKRNKRKKKKNKENKEQTKQDGKNKGNADAMALKDRGNKAYQEENYKKAVDLYSQAIGKDPKNHALYSNRSATHAAMKDFKKSLDDANKVIKLKPDWAKGYYRKGHALEQLLKYNEAQKAYKDGLEVAPADPTLTKAGDILSSLMAELHFNANAVEEDSPDKDKFQVMIDWMRKHGAKFPKMYMRYYSDDYRGVHALTKIPPDDMVLYVPLKCIMTSEVAKASAIGRSIIESHVDLRSKHSYLASYLLQEKHKKKSYWDPYLHILPQHYANMPIFFDEDLLSWLKGSFSLHKISDRIDSLRKEYDNIRRSVKEFNVFHLDDFVWARLAVITRIFGMNIDGKKTDGLVPYADMLNHKRPRETKWTYDDKVKGFLITSLKTIQRGEQIFDSYGRKCNHRFFVNYGFTLDKNDDNEAVIQVELSPSDAQYDLKVRFLGGRRQTRREFQIPKGHKEKKDKEFFSFMRFLHAKDAELMMLSSSDGFKLDEIEPISVRNEIAALKHIQAACEKAYALFPHSLEHDLKILEEEKYPMFSNERNCVVMRRGEKEVLRWFIDLAKYAIPLLKLTWKDLKKVAAKAYQSTKPIDHYVTVVVVPLVKKSS